MSNQNPYQHTSRRRSLGPGVLFFIIFMGLGGFFFVLGCYFIWNDYNFRQTALVTTGIITHIDVSYDSDGDSQHTVFVAFTLNGRKYEGRLGYYISGMQTGKEVKFYYNPDNPADFRGRGASIGNIVFALFGFIFLTIGLLPLILDKRRTGRNSSLLANGRRIDVKIAEVYKNTSLSVNGKHPYKIRCQGFDHSGEYREFESENLWYDPRSRLDELNLKTLPVYLHATKQRKYYVDVRSL